MVKISVHTLEKILQLSLKAGLYICHVGVCCRKSAIYTSFNSASRLNLLCLCGRCGGLVVSTLDSGSRGPGSSPGRVILLCSWAKHFTLTVPLSTQEYKTRKLSGKPDKMLGGYLRWTSIPSRRSSNTPSHFMLRKPG